jgi:hypothetical protein
MVLFAFAAVVALLGVGVYDLYNPGRSDLTMAGYHFAAVPTWVPVALGAAVPLSFFLLHALWTGVRIWWLKGAVRREPEWDLVEPWPPAPRRVEMARPRAVQPPVARAPLARDPVVRAPVARAPVVRAPVAQDAAAVTRRRRASQAPPPAPGPQPAPKRSWLSHRD